MTTTEQETLKALVLYDAQTRLKAYLTKHPNRAVTTEHIRWQTQDGVWYDRNTYQLPLFAQHKLRNVMKVIHEADSDGIHTISEMAEAERYTVHTEADHQGNPDIRKKTYLLLPQATGTRRNHDRRLQRAPIQTECRGREDERVDQIVRALSDPGGQGTDPGIRSRPIGYHSTANLLHGLPPWCSATEASPLHKRSIPIPQIPGMKWSPEHETLVDHLQPKPIMVLHLDNTITCPHTKPTHSRRAHQYTWDWRTAQIHCNQNEPKLR